MGSYVIDEIIRNRKVTDYLETKGHRPVASGTNGALKYLCPLHKERTPSFYVYTNGEFENYFCYGCKARYHVIHLYRDLEGVSTKEAIQSLANGLELDVNAEIAHAVREVTENLSTTYEYSSVELSLILNRQLYHFIKKVDSEQSCLESCEKLFKLIDTAVETNDLRSLRSLYDNLTDVLAAKVRWYRDLQEERIKIATAGGLNRSWSV